MIFKKCLKCNKLKVLSEFHKKKTGKLSVQTSCKDCTKIQSNYYYIKNLLKIKQQKRIYYLENKEKISKQKSNYKKEKLKTNVKFRLTEILRSRLYLALHGKDKALSTMFLIGCEIDYLMYYIQERFKFGMSWDNYGDWHIDHKLPCASFDLSKKSEQLKCFNFKNLQPLWAIDNLRKGSRI